MLLHQLGLEGTGSVTRRGQLKLAVLDLQGLVSNAVAVVIRLGLFIACRSQDDPPVPHSGPP